MFYFNLAFALFKLDENDNRVKEIWQKMISDEEPYFKMLA
jgi:hypothetical protein